MSSIAVHEAEQAAITALCESGECDHSDCNETWLNRAYGIQEETRKDTDDNRRRAVRALLTVMPEYDDDTLSQGLADLLGDIRHLCDLVGWSFADIDRMAFSTYQREVVELSAANDARLAAAIKSQLE